MAARRLKFKPKPLVGLIRRNKDQNEQDILKQDLMSSETNSQKVDSLTPESHLQESFSKDTYKNSDSTTAHNVNNIVPEYNHSSINELVTVKENTTFNQVKSETVNKDGEISVEQNYLKCDINNKIKSVLSGRTLGVCSPISSDSNNYNTDNISTDRNDITQSENPNCTADDAVSVRDDGINSTELTVSGSDGSTRQQTVSSTEDTPVSNDELIRRSDSSDTADVNSLQRSTRVNDKKDTKSNSQRVLSRFGKARLKPSLSNVVRNKKDTMVEGSNKIDDISRILPAISDVTKNTSSASIVNPTIVSGNEENITVVNSNSNLVVEECVQVERRDNHNDCISEEPCCDVVQPTKSQSNTTTNADLVITTEPADKSVSNTNKGDCISTSIMECETEDGSVRTPVKLFQPNKRQRSHGQSYTSLTIKAMQNFKDKFKNGPIDKSKLMMRDLIFYNPTSNPMPPRKVSTSKKDFGKHESLKSNGLVDELLEEEKVDDVENDENDSLPVPQVKVGPDGKIIIDPKSLVIEATGVQKNRENLEKSEIVEENEFSYTKFHRKKVRRSDWTAEETLLFYKALNDLGADFSLMQSLFPKRTRRDLKLKFKKEERTNCNLIDKAMTSCGNFDFTALENELQKDREERVKKYEEMKRLAQEKKKLALAMKKPVKKPIKRRSAAEREFDDTDVGVVRVGRKYELEMKRKANNEIEARKLKRSKGVQRRKNMKRKPDDDDSSDQDDMDMFDFRLTDSFDDYNNHDDMDNVDSGDGGAVDKDGFRSLDSRCAKRTTDNDEDNIDSDSGFNSRILTKTRSGRQPKLKTNKDPATMEYIRQLKQFKQTNTPEEVKIVSNTEHFVPELPIMETVNFNSENFQRLTNSEMQERLENCYQLFGEPLDLTVPGEGELLVDRFAGGDSCSNENSYILPVLSDMDRPEADSTSLFNELNVEDTINKGKNRIADALQIVEELTSENDIHFSVDMNEPNCLYLQSDIQGKQDTTVESTSDIVPSCSQIPEDDPEYCCTNGETDEFIGQCGSDIPPRPSIIIKTLQPGRTQIQVLPKEQLSYIFRSSNIILQNGTDEGPAKMEEPAAEIISHSGIHCYPSSDHTYTSLVPKPPEPKSTYVILAPMNIQEFS